MLTSECYLQHCKNFDLSVDSAQLTSLQYFDRLWQDIDTYQPATLSIWEKLLGKNPSSPITGLYIWGGVGRGKTMLMDIFHDSVDIKNKQRLHFHRFMLQIHQALKKLKKTSNPLSQVAHDIAQRTRLLCLDEFHVNDITDAMLLHGLLEALFAENVILVTTSNLKPDDLYAEGLQRARFLPAIELIKSHTQVVELSSNTDYRFQTIRSDGTWHFPLDKSSQQSMRHTFDVLSSHTYWAQNSIEINSRSIPVLGQSEGTVWFEFKALCASPRSQNDYIEIACQHHTVLISNMPTLDDRHNDTARRLINLLDIFYDHRVKLIVSAETPINLIYRGERLAFEFTRAISRLTEMQSEQYLAQMHKQCLPLQQQSSA